MNQHIIHNRPLSGVRPTQTVLQFDGGERGSRRTKVELAAGLRCADEFAAGEAAMVAARVTNYDCQLVSLIENNIHTGRRAER